MSINRWEVRDGDDEDRRGLQENKPQGCLSCLSIIIFVGISFLGTGITLAVVLS